MRLVLLALLLFTAYPCLGAKPTNTYDPDAPLNWEGIFTEGELEESRKLEREAEAKANTNKEKARNVSKADNSEELEAAFAYGSTQLMRFGLIAIFCAVARKILRETIANLVLKLGLVVIGALFCAAITVNVAGGSFPGEIVVVVVAGVVAGILDFSPRSRKDELPI